MAVQTAHIDIQGLTNNDFCVMEMGLKMELLRPTELTLTLRGRSKPISLSDASNMMGVTLDVTVKTQRRDNKQEIIDNENLTFHGIVFGVKNGRSLMGQIPVVTLKAFSPDYLLIDHPHCQSFEDCRLEQIVKKAIGDYTGSLTTSIKPYTSDSLPYTVQYNEDTYQFLSRLAMRYGEYMYHDGKRFVFGQIPNPQKVNLYPDIDILSYHYSMEMAHNRYTIGGHDYMSNDNPKISSSPKDDTHYQKETFQDYAGASPIGVTNQELKGAMNVEQQAFLSGRRICHLRTQCAHLRIGDSIVIGEYDSGEEMIKHPALTIIAIRHNLNADGHYENKITAILSGVDTRPPYPQGEYYPHCNTQRAVVTDNDDPEKLGRVRVQFLWQAGDKNLCTPWLRIAQPHTGGGKGFYFIPEIGEEVMVAFEGGNAERPYIVGSLYHGEARPDESHYNEGNDIKAIRTRNGHTIEIHDEGEGGYIRIYDNPEKNYILTFSTDEKLIKLESSGNIELTAKNDIIMHAEHDIIATAENDMKMVVKHDRTLEVDNNDSNTINNNQNISVAANQTCKIGNNQSVEISEDQTIDVSRECGVSVGKKATLMAREVEIEGSESIGLKTKNHKQKANQKMSIDGGGEMDIKAGKVKIN